MSSFLVCVHQALLKAFLFVIKTVAFLFDYFVSLIDFYAIEIHPFLGNKNLT